MSRSLRPDRTRCCTCTPRPPSPAEQVPWPSHISTKLHVGPWKQTELQVHVPVVVSHVPCPLHVFLVAQLTPLEQASHGKHVPLTPPGPYPLLHVHPTPAEPTPAEQVPWPSHISTKLHVGPWKQTELQVQAPVVVLHVPCPLHVFCGR